MIGFNIKSFAFTPAFLEKTMAFFFAVLLFVLPLSGAAAELSVVMIILVLLLRLFCFDDRRTILRDFFLSPFTVSALVFWVVMIPSVPGAGEYSQKALRALVSKWGEALLIYIAAVFTFSRVRTRSTLLFLLAGCVMVCMDALFQKATGADLLRRVPMLIVSGGNGYGVTATFYHYNDLGSYLIFPLFTSLAVMTLPNDVLARRMGIWTAPLMLAVLFFTFSRSAWVAVVAGMVGLAWLAGKRKRAPILIILAIVMMILAAVPVFRERVLFMFAPDGDQDRFRMWHAAWLMFSESPLWGKGLGTFMDRITTYKEIIPIYAHNCYFQILAETGLLGFAGFMGVLCVLGGRINKYLSNFTGDRFFKAMTAGIIAFMVAMFFETQLYSVKTSLLFWTMLGICVGYMVNHEEKSVIPDK